jgi:hypothetical protein
MKNNNNAASFVFESITLTTNTGKAYGIAPLVMGYSYYEDISKPFITANLNIVDSAINIIGSEEDGGITGGESVEIKVKGPDEQTYTYNFIVYRVGDRMISNKIQRYNIGLISAEALTNEGRKVSNTQEGYPHEIVESILTEFLDTDKEVTSDPSQNRLKIIPSGKSPFSVIASIQDKTLLSKSSTAEQSSQSGEFLSGSAGYFFFENHNGYNFRSIDSLCDLQGKFGNQQTEVKTFVDSAAEDSYDDTILSVQFLGEINLMEGLRLGAYASKAAFYNMSTGEYEQKIFSAKKSFENQAHLGAQDTLNPEQERLSDYPTRQISAIIDHETFYSGQDSASPNGSGDNQLLDWSRDVICQSISRNYLLNTQGLRIEVPGNLDLVVGDKVRVLLPNSSNQEDRKNNSVDRLNSGYYLVTQISRAFAVSNMQVRTSLRLQRDSLGMVE